MLKPGSGVSKCCRLIGACLKNTSAENLLWGLLKCGEYSASYVYVTRKRRSGALTAYYRCRAQLIPAKSNL